MVLVHSQNEDLVLFCSQLTKTTWANLPETYRSADTLEDVHVCLSVFLVGVVHDGEEDEVVVDLTAVILEDGGGILDGVDRESLQLFLL